MFSLSLEFFKAGVKDDSQSPSISALKDGTKLTLPLERTALEQINYTKWYYSDSSNLLFSKIKESYKNDGINSFLKLNVNQNTFALNKPVNTSSDEFYFLFDYIKDSVINKGFELRDAIQEAISNETSYIEFEIFYLYHPVTQQYITLEIRSYKGSHLNITGHCSSLDNVNGSVSEVRFLECVKEIFKVEH